MTDNNEEYNNEEYLKLSMKIENLFCHWYDNRKGMPPAAYESWKAGWDAAIESVKNEQL